MTTVVDLAALLPDPLPFVRRAGTRARRFAYAIGSTPLVEVTVIGRNAKILSLDLRSGDDVKTVGYALRYVAADLASNGIGVLSTAVSPPAHAARCLRTANFVRSSDKLWTRFTPRFPHLLRNALSYAPLKGTNRVCEQIAVAEIVAERFSRVRGVHAVLGLGSIARGFADRFSDIDLFVMGRGSSLRALPTGEHWIAGNDLDIFVIDVAKQPYDTWDLSRRQAVSEAVVLYQRDPHSLAALRRHIALHREECRRRVSEALLQLGWIGFHPRSLDGQSRYGYKWVGTADAWISRGDVASAHHTVDRASAWMMELLFLANKRLLPDPKWQRFVVRSLPWLPAQFEQRLTAVEDARRRHADFYTRATKLFALIDDVFARLEQRRLVPADVYGTYLSMSDVYTSERGQPQP